MFVNFPDRFVRVVCNQLIISEIHSGTKYKKKVPKFASKSLKYYIFCVYGPIELKLSVNAPYNFLQWNLGFSRMHVHAQSCAHTTFSREGSNLFVFVLIYCIKWPWSRISYRNGYEGLLSFLKLLSYCIFSIAIVISFECL